MAKAAFLRVSRSASSSFPRSTDRGIFCPSKSKTSSDMNLLYSVETAFSFCISSIIFSEKVFFASS